MIIGQTGDWHLEEKRLPEQVACIEHMLTEGTKAGVQLWLILGDVFGTKVPYHGTELERLTFKRLIRKMGHKVIVRGNHDADLALDLYEQQWDSWENHWQPPATVIVNQPMKFETYFISGPPITVVAFPYPSKRWVVGTEGPTGIESLRLDLGQRLFEILRGLLLSVETEECILVGHCNVGGSRTGGGEILAGQEIEQSKAMLQEMFEIQPKLRYIGLGHIHQAQEIIPGAWYAGTPASQGFDRCNEHGFLIIDTNQPRVWQTAGWKEPIPPETFIRFIPTPATRHYTVDVEWQEDETGWCWGDLNWKPATLVGFNSFGKRTGVAPDNLRDAMIKLRPRIPESQRKQADYTRVVDELRLEGATVIFDPCIIPHSRQREVALLVPPPSDVAARGKASLREGLAQLWQSQKPQPAMAVQARALKVLDD